MTSPVMNCLSCGNICVENNCVCCVEIRRKAEEYAQELGAKALIDYNQKIVAFCIDESVDPDAFIGIQQEFGDFQVELHKVL